jgi:Xaa-Pro aminopeptidase
MEKLRRFQDWMKSQRIDLVLLFNSDPERVDSNFRYFSGYTGFGLLGITQKKAMIAVSKMERLRAMKESSLSVVSCSKRMLPELRRRLGVRVKKVGVDKSRISLQQYTKLRKDLNVKYVDISAKCLEVRASKTEAELKDIRKACAITDEIFHDICMKFRSFRSEDDIARFIKEQAALNADGISFSPIVGSGKNACMAHHVPDRLKLNKGFCVMDFGVKVGGYCSDLTRTVYIGQPTEADVSLYHKVLEVQEACIKKCVLGSDFGSIDAHARKLFGKDAKLFVHLIGHGVGLDIHEDPNPKKSARKPLTKLVENAVITIEPGLYVDNKLGIRIEDDILITKKGPVLLTKSGKNLLVIKK